MDASEPYHKLREQLRLARFNLDAGDTSAALKAVEAALVIDPACGAANVLRERIKIRQQIQGRERQQRAADSKILELVKTEARWEPAPGPAPPQARPVVSAEAWALFEKRVRERRLERCVRSARTAITEGRVIDASAALAEIRELDPQCRELDSLQIALNRAARGSGRQTGPYLAAAAVFCVIVFMSGSWVEPINLLFSRPIEFRAESPTGLPSEPLAALMPDEAAGELNVRTASPPIAPRAVVAARVPSDAQPRTPQVEAPARVDASVRSAASARSEASPRVESAPSRVDPPASMPIAPAPFVVAASWPVTTVASVPTPALDDEALVRQALQKYRAAYSGLDARLAQAVWPGVNGAALARAFSGLESQELQFSACRVDLRGSTATAVCRGSASYVPKVGSREPRLEARVWNFALRKTSGSWQIDTARAE